jgi:cytochrome P450
MLPIPFVPEIVLGGQRMLRGQRMLKSSDEAIEKYKHQLIKNKDNPKMSLFTKLFNSVDSDSLTYEEIRDEAFTYLLAGSSPTGTTLTYLVWAVCQHKEVQKALVSEVCSLPENFTDQDVRRLPYLEQVINETLRLYAIAPSGLARAVPSSGAELAGFFIPAGVTVSTQAYTLHRDPKIFPDPLR